MNLISLEACCNEFFGVEMPFKAANVLSLRPYCDDSPKDLLIQCVTGMISSIKDLGDDSMEEVDRFFWICCLPSDPESE
jgi:hypothetical protein